VSDVGATSDAEGDSATSVEVTADDVVTDSTASQDSLTSAPDVEVVHGTTPIVRNEPQQRPQRA